MSSKEDSLFEEEIEDLETCCICKECYDEKERLPKILPSCTHTFCLCCIKVVYNDFLLVVCFFTQSLFL